MICSCEKHPEIPLIFVDAIPRRSNAARPCQESPQVSSISLTRSDVSQVDTEVDKDS